jgi:hypothetical protein
VKDTKLWKTNFQSSGSFPPQPLEKAHEAEIETTFEDILIQYPSLIMENLKLLCGKIETTVDHSELLGVDGEGRLVVLELEKGMLTSSSVAHIINYASYIHEMTNEELANYIKFCSGNIGLKRADDFLVWYETLYQAPFSVPKKLKMILIGLDFDDQSRSMVKFLADNRMDISVIIFNAFQDHDQYVIAMQRIQSTDRNIPSDMSELGTSDSGPVETEKTETTLKDLVKYGS